MVDEVLQLIALLVLGPALMAIAGVAIALWVDRRKQRKLWKGESGSKRHSRRRNKMSRRH